MRPLPVPLSDTDMHGRKTGIGKRHFEAGKIENSFSLLFTHVGARKKLMARISKSEPLILKSKPLIFCSLKTPSHQPETNGYAVNRISAELAGG